MTYPTRQIDYHELLSMLNHLESESIKVPTLKTSEYKREYSHTEGNIEFYTHNGQLIRVMDGEVIDDYGNVVDIEVLESRPRIISENTLEELVTV